MPTIEVQITSAQNTKLKRNETIQLSYEALTQTNSKSTHDAEIDVSDAVYKKVQSAIRRGKGIRIVQGEYEGGSIWKKTKDFAKSKTGRAIGKIGQRVGQKALDYSIDKGVPMAINAGAAYLSGGSVSVSVLQKGSQEAKDKMARLRAMRGSGIGKAFKSVGKSISKVADSKVGHSIAKISTQAGKRAISVGLPVAGTAIGSALGTAIGGPGFGTAVGGVIGSQVGKAGASVANKKIGGRGFGIGSVRDQVRTLEDRIATKSIDPHKLLYATDSLGGKFMERDHDIHGKGFLPIGRGFTPI
jgi:hypothetical protein